MGDVGEEAQLVLRHALHVFRHLLLFLHAVLELFVVSGLCHVCLQGKHTCHDEQHHEEEQHEEIAALRVEGVGGGFHPFPQREQIVALPLQLFVLHEQHVGIVGCDEG